MFRRLAALLLCAAAPIPAPAATRQPAATPAPSPVTITDPVVLPAEDGQRALLVRVTSPASPKGRRPVILFSHGAALSRGQYAPLIEYWARHGYVVLQPDHEDGLVDGFPPPIAPSPELWRTRIVDMQRLARALPAVARAVPGLRGHLDASRIFAAGHSFGGHTVAALMGARVWNDRLNAYEVFDTPAIKGAVLLSPPGAGGADLSEGFRAKGGYLTVDWSAMRGPMLIVVGSDDESKALTIRNADWHADPYRRSLARNLCLVTLTGAKHYLGGIVDPRRTGVEDASPARLAAARTSSLALFEAASRGGALSPALFAPLGTDGTIACR